MASKKQPQKKVPVDFVHCVWGLVCSMSSIDQERNNISLFNVIDQINPPQAFFIDQEKMNKPIIFPVSHEVVLNWRRVLDLSIDESEILADFKVNVIDPNGKVLQETTAPLYFQKNVKMTRARIAMGGFALTTPGNYVYRVEIKQPHKTNFVKVCEIPFFANDPAVS